MGTTELHRAARDGDTAKVAQLLKEHLEWAKETDGFGCTPLHDAAAYDHTESVKLLAAACPGAASMKSKGGETPADIAKRRKERDWQGVVALLEAPQGGLSMAGVGASLPSGGRKDFSYMHERPTGGKDELAGMVHLVAGIDSDERRLIWGRYVAKGDYTAHMQLQEDLPPDIAGEVLFGGGIKPNGEWGGNSLYNNKPFRTAMNLAYANGLDHAAKTAKRAELKANYGNVECNDDQMEEVQKLFRQGKYRIARR